MGRKFFGLKLLLLFSLLIISTCKKESTKPEDEGNGTETDIEAVSYTHLTLPTIYSV